MQFNQRTHTCGDLRGKDAGEKVILNGWVDARRDLGGLIFIRLRDRYGITQIVFEPNPGNKAYEEAKDLRSEFVISVEGVVRKRTPENINPDMTTGEIEIVGEKLIVLNEAETTPFPIRDNVEAGEDLRLKYRYLDLRRPEMQKNFTLRHKMYQTVRNYFDSKGFIEVETPVLMKSTPEGARDYLVPSRIHKGKFYALPQSPQTYKQLLMVSGFDRYFQIVKCFRDEDFRADRQPEFTQIDVEMSFVTPENIYAIGEEMMQKLYKEIWNLDLQLPIPRLTFDEAIEKYGSDKPDLRFGLEMITLNNVFRQTEFKIFREAIDGGGVITGISVPDGGKMTRSQIDSLTEYVKKLGAGGMIWIRVKEKEIESPAAKFFSEEEKKNLVETFNASPGDMIFILSGKKLKTFSLMGALRLETARRTELLKPDAGPKLLWVTDFPLFEWDEETKRYYAMHHPFTSPRPEDIQYMESDPARVKARAYDLVLNGSEIAGGSIRIHNPELQSKMFSALGISKEEAEQKFGFLMNAFKYGAPPHGGIAFGFDRMTMIFAGESSIRDVIAFPKTASAVSLMDESPSAASSEQLKELHIKIV